MRPITRELAEYVEAARFEDLPQDALDAARRSLVNFVGVTVGGARHEAVDAALAGLRDLKISGDVPIFARSERVDAMSAALIHGISSAVLDFDSTQLKRTNIHPSGPILPALLALAATRAVGREVFLNAFVLGVEVACRIANGVFGDVNRGWHVTGAAGGIGAAVAVGKALDLGAGPLVHAIGIAANQACGLREMYGTMSKALTPGRAAQNGLFAALSAKHGFTGAPTSIEGPKGLAQVFAGIAAPDALAEGFGRSYEITANIYKPYPSAIVTHAAIDGCIRLCREHDIHPRQVTGVELRVPPIAIDLAGKNDPRTALESKFSLTHCAAVAVAHRGAQVEHFSAESLADPELGRLRAIVSLVPVEGLRKEEAIVRLSVTGLGPVEFHVASALGSLDRPMSDADINEKFLGLSVPAIGRSRAERLLALCMDLPVEDVGCLVRT